MANVTLEDVRQLAEHRDGAAVSIYVPSAYGPALLGTALREAGTRLADRTPLHRDAEEMLSPAQRLLESEVFWAGPPQGLALFLSAAMLRIYRLPVDFDPLTGVGSNFHITPLLAAVENGSEFYVVAVSKRRVRLLHGSRFGIADMELPGAPRGVRELHAEHRSVELQAHTHLHAAAGAGGGWSPVLHGTDGVQKSQEERLLHYLRAVDGAVARVLSERQAPLVFAGDSSLFSLYQAVNTYPMLVNRLVRGNLESLTRDDLHAKAWPLVSSRLAALRNDAVRHVHNAIAAQRGATRIGSILQNGSEGRNATLLLDKDEHEWGYYNPRSNQVRVLDRQEPDSEDLHNLAAVHTLRHGGRVFMLASEEMPEKAKAAAAFRY